MGRVSSLALCLLVGLVGCGEVSKNEHSAGDTSAGGTGTVSGSGTTDSGSASVQGAGGTVGTGAAASVVTSTTGVGTATTTSGTGGEPGAAGAPGTAGENTGGDGTGGAAVTTTGGTSLCDCDADPIPVCGVDGNTYDIACGDDCVPVEVDCSGACPCVPCRCVGTFFDDVCDVSMENDYRCNTDVLDYDLAGEYGCWVGGTDLEGSFGPVSMCCPLGYDAQDLCLDD